MRISAAVAFLAFCFLGVSAISVQAQTQSAPAGHGSQNSRPQPGANLCGEAPSNFTLVLNLREDHKLRLNTEPLSDADLVHTVRQALGGRSNPHLFLIPEQVVTYAELQAVVDRLALGIPGLQFAVLQVHGGPRKDELRCVPLAASGPSALLVRIPK